MARLIDADTAIKIWCKDNCGKDYPCYDNWDKCLWVLHLQTQPTAYDIDNVVRQLLIIEAKGFSFVTVSKAIELVKGGGVNE